MLWLDLQETILRFWLSRSSSHVKMDKEPEEQLLNSWKGKSHWRKDKFHLNLRETKWQNSNTLKKNKKCVANIQTVPFLIPDEVYSRANSFANNFDKQTKIYLHDRNRENEKQSRTHPKFLVKAVSSVRQEQSVQWHLLSKGFLIIYRLRGGNILAYPIKRQECPNECKLLGRGGRQKRY